MKTLAEMLTPGQKVRVFYSTGNINNQIRHIRGIVDKDMIVYRTWGKHRREWYYSVVWRYAFEYLYEKGILS